MEYDIRPKTPSWKGKLSGRPHKKRDCISCYFYPYANHSLRMSSLDFSNKETTRLKSY